MREGKNAGGLPVTVQCKSEALSVAPSGGLRVCAPRHLCATLPARYLDCPLVLPGGPSHLQSVAGLSGGTAARLLPGTLAEVEALVSGVEQARSLEAACTQLRMEIELPACCGGYAGAFRPCIARCTCSRGSFRSFSKAANRRSVASQSASAYSDEREHRFRSNVNT
jgi:hypothetical protein